MLILDMMSDCMIEMRGQYRPRHSYIFRPKFKLHLDS